MGKPITHEYGQEKTILKFFPYKAFAATISATGVTPGDDGRKVVKAGTPYPEAGTKCQGFLLHDVDVTQGDAPGSVVYEGTLDPIKLDLSQLTASTFAAVPKVNVFGKSYTE